MKAIMVMFDSLNRHMLPPYGCDWTHAPNFARLAERTVVFEKSYVCSMPCMPARREIHTARPNFLHCSWGPLEPFDDSVPRMLKENGVGSHLISDHYHYWESGGSTYHTQYETWQFHRGHEGDPWMGQAGEIPRPEGWVRWSRQDQVNRRFMRFEDQQPQAKTFQGGLEFIRRNSDQDRWFLQLETFDPHEPFFTQGKYQDLYREMIGNHERPPFDWPPYGKIKQSTELVEECKGHYAALLSMCDAYLGMVLDTMDELNMWEDTFLTVCTDHGFLLGEHDEFAKVRMPWYNENANTPFFIWDPRSGKRGERRSALVQPALDIGPTLLDLFGMEPTPDMLGRSLTATVANDEPVREAAIFGQHGGQIAVTDGRHVYMRSAKPDNGPLFDYTLMPQTMRGSVPVDTLRQAELAPAWSFTKGCPVLKLPRKSSDWGNTQNEYGHLLFDLESDPGQQQALQDDALEKQMISKMVNLMKACDAPKEQYQRLGLPA